ncbi:MAG: hypothetical protein N2A99_03160 [Carnobacterium alterfunditum]
MARSQLLIDAVSGKETLETMFLRLKVVLSDLESENIMNWVNGELEGYKPDEILPPYRIMKGVITGDYLLNFNFPRNNQPVPLGYLISKEEINKLQMLHIRDGIGTLQSFVNGEKEKHYGITLSTEYCSEISIDEIQIAGMRVTAPSNRLTGIISQVKTKLVDVIMELEKEFQNLDELDIRTQVKENNSIVQIITHIEKIIYDNSIDIGDNNKFTKSSIGNSFGENKE